MYRLQAAISNRALFDSSSSVEDIVNENSQLIPICQSEEKIDAVAHESRGGDMANFASMLISNKLNLLLFAAPFAIWSYLGEWSSASVFLLNFTVLLPLANILGEATEILALHTGDTVGGLINTTFGNAVELVIVIFALNKGELEVVQTSLIGSCLSNLLLVLGCCFIAGGIREKETEFNAIGASANSSLLMLSTFAMLLPTYTQYEHLVDDQMVILVSRITSIFMLLMYAQLLIFQLKTHAYLFKVDEVVEEAELTLCFSAGLLLITTVVVAFFSEILVSSIDGFTKECSVSKSFIGMIVLPIIGNAVEHATAVKVAYNGKMELAMACCIGSAAQISLYVVPVTVLVGWIIDQPMSMAFPIFDVVIYLMAIMIVYGVISDGKSHWFEGSMLITTYILTGITFLWIKQLE